MDDRLETLFEAWSSGELSDAEQAELRRLLQDPQQADRFVLLCGERQDLRDKLADQPLDVGPGFGRRVITFTAVGLVAAAVLVAIWFSMLDRLPDQDQELPAVSTADAEAEVLLGYDFSDGRVRQFGTIDTPIGWGNREGDLRFVDGGLSIDRTDYVAIHNPPAAESVLARLREAAAVTLQVRVRFASPAPPRCNLATLRCREPEDNNRGFLPLRWPAEEKPAGPTVHQVSLTLHRDGRQVHRIDGRQVLVDQRPWLFADWQNHWALLLHTHRGDADMPIRLVFESVRILVR